MIKGVITKKLDKLEDERGWLAEIFRQDETEFRPKMAYVSFSNFGVIRGPHEHVNQTDFFCFSGPGDFKMYLWDNRKDSPSYEKKVEMVVGQSNPTSILVPPGVVHGYKCISEGGAYYVNLPNKLYAGDGKKEDVDEIRWEGKEGNPFIIK